MAAPPAAVARLAAGAQGGTAGVKAYDAAQASVKASSKAAVGNLADDAAGMSGGTNGLEPQLRAEVAAPGGVALQNLARYGAAQQFANSAGGLGTQNYMQEASAAIPVINAEAARAESQREAMLAASIARSSAAKQPKALTDSALQHELLGYAENQRAARAQAAVARDTALLKRNQAAETNATHQSEEVGHWTDPGTANPNAQLEADLAANQQILAQAHQAALQNIQQQQYGPGITAEARAAGQSAGIDPNRLAGILGPTQEKSYVLANERLGLYRNPSAVENIASDPIKTATALGYAPKQYRDAAKATFIDWNGPTLSKAVNAWLKSTDPTAAKLAAPGSGATPQQIRDAFVAAHPGSQLGHNVVSDIIASAHHYVTQGMDYGTFSNTWLSDPNAMASPDAVKLGLAMVQQLFAYRQAQARQQALAPVGP